MAARPRPWHRPRPRPGRPSHAHNRCTASARSAAAAWRPGHAPGTANHAHTRWSRPRRPGHAHSRSAARKSGKWANTARLSIMAHASPALAANVSHRFHAAVSHAVRAPLFPGRCQSRGSGPALPAAVSHGVRAPPFPPPLSVTGFGTRPSLRRCQSRGSAPPPGPATHPEAESQKYFPLLTSAPPPSALPAVTSPGAESDPAPYPGRPRPPPGAWRWERRKKNKERTARNDVIKMARG